MLAEYPKLQRSEIEKLYESLTAAERNQLADYLQYRRARGLSSEDKLKDLRRLILRIRLILQKPLSEIGLSDLRAILGIINSTDRIANTGKNDLKIDLKNLVKYLFPDWSARFAGLEDVKLMTHPQSRKKKEIFQKKEIEKLVQHETTIFWKAFLLTQFEGGLRTKETRFLKWDDLKLNIDGDITEVNIFATKTQRHRTVFLKEASFYLTKLKEENEITNTKGVYVFPPRQSPNEPIDKSAVSYWFRGLTKRTLGKASWNYMLRHTRATELYRLVRENKMSKDNALEFLGHGDDMSHVYTHLDKQEVKEMLKNQVYKFRDLPTEKKHVLELQLALLNRKFEIWSKNFPETYDLLTSDPTIESIKTELLERGIQV